MQPSACAGALPPVVVDLPEAGRDDQLNRWGLSREFACDRGRRSLVEPEAQEWLARGDWHVASVTGGGRSGGLVSHRGVIHPDEYVDYGVLASEVEDSLGFSLDEVGAAYRQGRKASDTVALRDRIDARILAVVEAGGSRVWLARVLGWAITRTADGTEESRTLRRVLERAKLARAAGLAVAS